ncbi:MAG: carboxylating nicotinate-nucleotide diphosphorylase [Caldisphaeraceae archaeon]|nr:carboxylating nicotinate-nucleotide diphosphorylase [Caldisphaeraceae archaeon]
MTSCGRLLYEKLQEWIRDDSPYGDVTTMYSIERNVNTKGIVVAKSSGVAACIDEVVEALHYAGMKAVKGVWSGEVFNPRDMIIEVEGNAHDILLFERTLLNFLMYLSGIATSTRKLVEIVSKINPRIRIASTRKYPPGLSCFAKVAVRQGGGDTHRFGLSDAILIKDNHKILAGGLLEAVKKTKEKVSFMEKIEVEVNSVEEALKVARAGVDAIMFDNMRPSEISLAIEKLVEMGVRRRMILEVSGGINEGNIKDYASLDIDVISTSSITMRPERIDLSLEVIQ